MTDIAIKPLGSKSGDSDVIADCREALRLCMNADDAERSLSLAELEFEAGEHWTAEEIAARDSPPQRPRLTTNTLPAILHQVTNDNRQNRQSIKVHPVDDKADPEIADILEGLIRHIEYESNADVAYDTAVSSAAAIGFGFFRLVSEFSAPDSFDQDLKIKRIRNPFTVYGDPLMQEIDGSDARYWIVTSKISRIQFERDYPDAEATVGAFEGGAGDNNWFPTDEVRLAEYYRIEETPATLSAYSDGSTRFDDDKSPLPFGVFKVRSRPSMKRKVMWYKLTGAEILDSAEIPCDWIPIFPVWGDEIDINGKIKRFGLIRNAKDPCRMYNFWLTTATEEIALRPKTPYIGAVGQFETAKKEWQLANQRSYSYLEYDPVTVDGQIASAPTRQPMSDIPAGALQMAAHARDNIKATTGIYDASLGARGNETSGKGINARKRQGEIANFHYSDNLGKTQRQLGRCLLCMIRATYDKERVARILGEDLKAETVTLNQPNPNPRPDPKTGAVKAILNDVRVGKYDVVMSIGPAYNTRREEAMDGMLAVGQSWPKLMDLAGDKVIGAMDWPGAGDIAKRVERSIPAEIRNDPDDEDQLIVNTPKGPIPAAQAGDLIGRMDHAMHQMEAELDELKSGVTKAKIDAQSRERVAEIGAESRENVEEIKIYGDLLTPKGAPAASAARTSAPRAPALPNMHQGGTPMTMSNDSGAQSQILTALTRLLAMATAEREIVRGPDGKVAGVRLKQPGMVGYGDVLRDGDGKVTGMQLRDMGGDAGTMP